MITKEQENGGHEIWLEDLAADLSVQSIKYDQIIDIYSTINKWYLIIVSSIL